MYLFNQSQLDEINAAFNNSTSGHPHSDRYAKIHEIIQQPDDFGNSADVNVVAWFGAATQACASSDIYGQIIA